MSYTQIVYKDELDHFLKNFKELVMNNQIPDIKNKREMILFLVLFEKQLEETISVSAIYDLRTSMLGTTLNPSKMH